MGPGQTFLQKRKRFQMTVFGKKFIHPPTFLITFFVVICNKILLFFVLYQFLVFLHVFTFYKIPGPSPGPYHRSEPRGGIASLGLSKVAKRPTRVTALGSID